MSSTGRRWSAKKIAIGAILFVCIAYLLPLGFVYFFQRNMIYIPNTEHVGAPEEFGLKGVKVIPVQTEDGLALQDWFRPPKNGDKYTIVMFHGAYISLGNIAMVAPALMGSNHGLFFCEYRGFGDSPGKPTEQGVYTDARAAVKWLTSHGYPADHLIFYGSSLGTGIAIQMAKETPPAMVVLQSPYTRIADVAKHFYPMFPVDALLTERFDSIDKIGDVHAPLLIVHGVEDPIIPLDNAKQLFAAAHQPKTFMAVKQFHHNDLLFSLGVYKLIGNWIDSQIKAASH